MIDEPTEGPPLLVVKVTELIREIARAWCRDPPGRPEAQPGLSGLRHYYWLGDRATNFAGHLRVMGEGSQFFFCSAGGGSWPDSDDPAADHRVGHWGEAAADRANGRRRRECRSGDGG
jgi:hypothetical protein